MTLAQEYRRTGINTPLGPDVLVITSLEGVEELSRPFSYAIQMLSENDDLRPEDIVGQNVAIRLTDPDDDIHYINGFVRFFVNRGRGDRACMYTAEVVPWLWFLTRRTNCRIYQNLTVPQIVEQVFREAGLSDFEIGGLRGSYAKRDYCVQYRETDHDFVSRLLEEEGIFYYFRHEEGRHVLVLGDDPSGYMDCKDSKVRYYAPVSFTDIEDNLTAWEHRYEFRSGKVALADFNFETPQSAVRSKERTTLRLPNAAPCELYDYPGNFPDRGLGDFRARRCMEAEEAEYDRVIGSSKCRSFGPGRRFTVESHHLASEEGKSYVVTRVRHRVDVGAYVPGGDRPEGYCNDFEAMPAMTPFRPARTTPRSVVGGPQTAIVVGPAGEEIYTDKHGRVKVKFHWDRAPNADENSSCWLRVSQSWASRQWGAQFLPRIGDEVIVDFLEGDPDRPIITGRVYNAETTPPYSLPDNKHVSGLRTNSTKGGGGSNEIKLDDTKGKENFYIHAQYDMNTVVEHDESLSVGANRTKDVGMNETMTVHADRTRTVLGNEAVTIALTRTHTVGVNEAITVGAAQEVTVGGLRAVTVGASQSVSIGADLSESVGNNYSETVGQTLHIKAGKDGAIEIGKNLSLVAGDQIVLKTGDASIIMKKDGSIQIKGKDIKIDASGKIVAKAGGEMVLKGGSKVTIN